MKFRIGYNKQNGSILHYFSADQEELMLTLENVSFDVKDEKGEKDIIKNLSLTIDAVSYTHLESATLRSRSCPVSD